MCDERQCKRQPNNDYCHCEDHYMQMSNADCAPRSNTGCTPYQLEALENMCKMSCKENPLEYLIRAEANERAQATEAEGKKKEKKKAAAKIPGKRDNKKYEALLKKSGQTPDVASIKLDKTKDILNTDVFQNDLDDFFSLHERKTDDGKIVRANFNKEDKLVPFEYIVQLVKHGNFGMINLIIGVANYGVSGVPEELKKEDPWVIEGSLSPEDAWKPHCKGKNPFDYKQGGVGIAHFDVGNLHTIYETYGLPGKEFWQKNKDEWFTSYEEVLKVLYKNPSTLDIVYKDETAYPVVKNKNNKPEVNLFDDVIDQYKGWSPWMSTIVQKTEFQTQFFKRWMTEYWEPAKKPLAKNKNATLADLNLNSRAKNSSGTPSTNKPWETRYNNYVHSKDDKAPTEKKKKSHQNHHKRQYMEVQRANRLEQYILSHPELLDNVDN